MDQVRCRTYFISFISLLGRKLVGTFGCTIHLRRIYHQEDTLAVVERCRTSCKVCDELGRCLGVCLGGGVLHQPLRISKLRHSIVLFREIIAYRRLSFREQGELWTAYSTDTTHNAPNSAHTSCHQHEELFGISTLGLSASERAGRSEA